jgi:hypothetical protein
VVTGTVITAVTDLKTGAIITQYSSGKFLKVPHTYLFDKELTVN